ncbi:MAG: uncharacterized protein JWQ35_2488 [Bacteriovoracaceae bacterium]|nr:uncharacterized protein [Bacteriovoracaceae bacterium]
MALIPEHYLKAIVAIGSPQQSQVSWQATGFLFGHLLPSAENQEPHYKVFLVTNRHVLLNQSLVVLRFDNYGTGTTQFPVPLVQNNKPVWIAHSDPDVDVAILPIDGNLLYQNIGNISLFKDDTDILPLYSAKAKDICEGDGIFVMGFPLGLVHQMQNFAVVRRGIISRIKDCMGGHSKDFLVDAQIFPGNSGGPVVSKPEVISIQGTQSINGCLLLGVVSAYLPFIDIAVSKQTGRNKISFEENSGLGVVYPVDRIQEVIKQFLMTLNPVVQSAPIGSSSILVT